MSTRHKSHLDEDQLLWAIVDTAGLPDAAQMHLAGCPLCRDQKHRLENDLNALGQIAGQLSPKLQKRVVVPMAVSPSGRIPGWHWEMAMGAAVAVLLVISIMWWPGAGLLVPDANTPVTAWDQQDDEKFMAQVRALIDNDLPQVYLDISKGLDSEEGESFIDFVVPSPDPDVISYDSANRRSLS